MIMSNTKYKIRKDLSIEFEGHTLYRIEATRNIDCDIIKGHLGGYIEEENNLSRYDNCWIYDNAKVFDNAFIHHNARIFGNAQIYGNAVIYGYADVFNNAQVFGGARIYGNANILDNAIIKDKVHISDYVIIAGNSIINSYTRLFGYARIFHNMIVSNTEDVIFIGPIGSREAYTTFIKQDDVIYVTCGCFFGNIEEFEKAVMKHPNRKHCDDYMDTIEYIKKRFNTIDKYKSEKSSTNE